MAKRYIDVYEDTTDTAYHIGIRDDGAATIWGSDVLLDAWARHGGALLWQHAEHADTIEWSADCGKLIGRVEYDDGLPDVACEPST